MATIHVLIGTKAQYVKTAPLLRLMDERGVPYRLVDSGQHAALSVRFREELGVRAPDLSLGGPRDVTSIPQALSWSLRLAGRLVDRRRLRRELFAGESGICVVHGDTPSTLLTTLFARRAGLVVAHLEAGLRSHRLLHPFPEELVRLGVMRLSTLLFAPDEDAAANLARMGLASRVVPTPGNAVVDALRYSLGGAVEPHGPVVATCHRVENLHRPRRLGLLVRVLCDLAARGQRVTFVVHGPTEPALEARGWLARLHEAGVEVRPLSPHRDFVQRLAAAPLVITDGGSVQEECALLGVPTLLWRAHTERPDGLDRNVVLGRYDDEVIRSFLRAPEHWRHPPVWEDRPSPSERILEVLLCELGKLS